MSCYDLCQESARTVPYPPCPSILNFCFSLTFLMVWSLHTVRWRPASAHAHAALRRTLVGTDTCTTLSLLLASPGGLFRIFHDTARAKPRMLLPAVAMTRSQALGSISHHAEGGPIPALWLGHGGICIHCLSAPYRRSEP